MKPKYYFIVDNSGFGFSYIIEVESDGKIFECKEVPSGITGPYLKSICEREIHFTNRNFPNLINSSYYGWTISRNEYNHIRDLIDLYPSYLRYIKLL